LPILRILAIWKLQSSSKRSEAKRDRDMKVVCANDTYKGQTMYLTLGKAYEVVDLHPFQINDQMYQIVNDRGALAWYDREIVVPLEEWRSKQLNEIGL
jgi:hypothetical protein